MTRADTDPAPAPDDAPRSPWPVLIGHRSESVLYVFPPNVRCTARTLRRVRCRNPAVEYDDHPVQARWRSRIIGDRLLDYFGPVTGELAEAYLRQRCPVHREMATESYCEPDWHAYDPQQHQLTRPPRAEEIFGRVPVPPVAVLAHVLRHELSRTDRELLAGLLTHEPGPENRTG